MCTNILRAIALFLVSLGIATAQTYPSKQILWVQTFSAGSSTDLLARSIAPTLGEALRVPVVVETRTGAGGSIGVSAVARAAPDGYTILVGTAGHMVINPHLYANLSYDPMKDLTFIASIAKYENVLLVNSMVPVKDVAELVEYAKANPGKVTFGSGGNGTSTHLSAEIMKSATGAPIVHVPYKGNSQAMGDLLAGNITFMFDLLSTGLSRIASGKVRPLAVTGTKRTPFAPEIPTMAEAGVPRYAEMAGSLWVAAYGPAGMPRAVTEALRAAFLKALDSPEVKVRLQQQKFDPWNIDPQQYPEFFRSESKKWGDAVKASGAKLD